jgi:hypothetical protein
MQARYTKHFIFSLIFSFAFIFSYSQTNSKDSANYITKRASSKYNTSNLHNFFWGKHYRKEWYTPVTFKKVILDTLKAGLTPYKTGELWIIKSRNMFSAV